MNFSRYIVLALKGCAMGMADVVPGVSGGTIAFISGIYEELLDSIRSVNATALKLLLKLRLGEFWRHINGSFLLPVLLGIAIAIFSLARLMTYLLTYHPIAIWSFFFGLIIASALLVARQETDRMADTITAQTATDQPVRRETVHTEIIMAKVDIITVTMVTDQPVREITEARDQTAETRDRSTTEDRDRDSIRETAAEDAIITSAEEITVED